MRKFSRAILLFLFPTLTNNLPSNAQFTKEDTNSISFFNRLSKEQSIIDNIDSSKTASLNGFASIQFLDARFDQSCIGYADHKNNKSILNKVKPKGSLTTYLTSSFNNKGQQEAISKTLLCVIHSFRIIEIDSSVGKDHKKRYLINKLVAKVDVFVEQNKQYHAALRYDSILIDTSYKIAYKQHIIQLFAHSLTKRILSVNINRALQKTGYSYNDIVVSINEKYEIPILKDTVYKKGVYVNFNEFVKNKPTYEDYEIKKAVELDNVYVKENGNYVLERNVFGYSDGKQIWIKLGNNFFLLNKIGNSFEFLGFKKLLRDAEIIQLNSSSSNHGQAANLAAFGAASALLNHDNMVIDRYVPFILDMEKGTIL
ncbi:MAG: hypothetical protein H7178_07320 [Chitinophagaceae bacterium]|nr:hypothetical protein [Chitinophagaceae bacterium]